MGACLCLHSGNDVPGARRKKTAAPGETQTVRPLRVRNRAQDPHFPQPPFVNVPATNYKYQTPERRKAPIRILNRLPLRETKTRTFTGYTAAAPLYRGRGEGEPGAATPAARFLFPSLDTLH